jgi:hypothetical protein
MYKIIHHISGKEIGILMGLEKKYLSLKTQKLKAYLLKVYYPLLT